MTQDSDQRYGLELEVLEEDKLSCRVGRIRHRGPALPDFEALQQKAERVIDQVTYLEDRLRLVEQDAVQEAILLRSESPHQQDDSLDYYEIRLSQDGLTEIGSRQYKRSETELSQRDMVLNHRQLERLGQDLGKLSKTSS